MLEPNEGELLGSTQQRIARLRNALEQPSSSSSPGPRLHTLTTELAHQYQQLGDKVGTLTAYLGEVQRETGRVLEARRKLRLQYGSESTVEDIGAGLREFYGALATEQEVAARGMTSRMLQLKMASVEHHDKATMAIELVEYELVESFLKDVKQKHMHQLKQAAFQPSELEAKIAKLKKSIHEDSQKAKQSIKSAKTAILSVCQEIQRKCQAEEQSLRESFDMHCNTLSKLIGSLAQKLI